MARTRQTARRSMGAHRGDDEEESSQNQQLTPAELLALSVDQLLAPDFIAKQTRGANEGESKTESKSPLANVASTSADEDDDNGGGAVSTQSASSLVASVIKESRTEHLKSGFRAHDNVREASAVLQRLSRELTAQALSADSFQPLANKRSTLLATLYTAFGDELKARKGVNLRKKKLDTKVEPLTATAIQSGVYVMLCILEDAARSNQTLALNILGYLSAQIQGVPSGAFANGMTAPVPAVSSQAFESIHQFLMRIASDSFTSHEIRSRCIELLLGLSIICSSLPYFLSVLQLLLLPPSRSIMGMASVAIAPTGRALTHLNVLSLLHKLQSSNQVHWEPPSKAIRDSQSVINELSSAKHAAIATDGTYLYIHGSYGLLKVGTGNNDTTPGTVYAEVPGYRKKERSCLICVGDKLYYRSPSIHPHAAIVLSTKYLLEIGHVDENGRGSYATADLSSIGWAVKPPDDDDKDEKTEEKKVSLTADAIQLRLRDCEVRMQQMENEGNDDEDRAMALEEESSRLAMALERIEGGETVTEDDIAPPRPAGGAAGAAGANGANGEGKEEEEKVGKISVMSGYAPFTSDGRFVYLLRPTPAGASTTKSEVNVVILDPEATQKLEQAHSVVLRVPPGRSDAILQFGGSADDSASRKKKRRDSSFGMGSKKSSSKRGNGEGGPSLTLGSPDHLNFDGSITMECWVRVPDEAFSESYQQGLFYHGDGGQMTHVTIQAGGAVRAGVNANVGSAHVSGIAEVDWNEWNHVAVTYSQEGKLWAIIVNGTEIATAPSPQGPIKSSATWSIGSSFSTLFGGNMAEVRIWRRCLPAKEIETNMKRVVPSNAPQLVGYWPLNDGIGMCVQDLSRYQHSGSISAACRWDNGNTVTRPFDHSVEEGVFNAYKFTNEALDKAIIYTNGESLALLYPRASAASVFPGVTTAIFQVFNLDTGLLVQESEHTYAAEAIAGVYDSSDHMLYMIQGSAGACVKYRLRPPQPFKAEWRVARTTDGSTVTVDTFPTTRTLQDNYPLRVDEDDKRVTLSSTSGSSSKTPVLERPGDDDSVAITTISVHVLARLEQDCASLQHVDMLTIPPSLQYTLGVDLSKPTFTSLLTLAEGLAADYFKPSLAEYGAHGNVRMFAFLTILRLLRINVTHLVGWNVDPKECGFLDDRAETKVAKKAIIGAATATPVKALELLFGGAGQADSKMQHRFVDLLNRLIVEAPTNKPAMQVREMVCEHVCETLSIGMAVFYGLAPDRLRILSDLVQEVISLGKRANPLRMLLLTRYFGSQSKAANVVSIVPALVSLHERKQALANGAESKDVKALDARDETTSTILEKVSYLVLNEARSLIAEHFEKKSDGRSATPTVGGSGAGSTTSSAFGTSMRDFLARVQVCLLSRMDEHAEQKAAAAALAKKQKKENDAILASSPNSKVTVAATTAPVVTNVQEQFTIAYSLQLIAMCQDLLDFCMMKINSHFPDATTNPTGDPRLMATILVVTDALKTSVGSLLRPLLSGLWSVSLDVRAASGLLPSLHRLLATLDALSSLTPDVRMKEAAFVNGKSQRLLTTRTSFVESTHPLTRQGQTEKTLTIPGATELVLDIDPRTFQGGAPGSSLVLYRSPGQKDPIENGTFTSQPQRAIRVSGDSVTIVFTCGYARSGRAWGWKVNAKAILEEASLDLPWLLDLTKSVGVLAGRCAGVIMRGESLDDTEKDMEKVLDTELLSEGLEYDDSVNRNEVTDLKWLPTLSSLSDDDDKSSSALSRPPLGRQASYMGVSLDTLSSQFAARMREKKVSVEHFPVPDSVRAIVDHTIEVVVGVLIKHNQLVTEVKTFLASSSTSEPSPSLLRVWKTPHKLRQWLLKRFQDRKNKEETKLAEAEKKKKEAEAADKDDDHEHKSRSDSKSSKDSMDTKADGKEVKMDTKGDGEVKEVDRTAIYKELCDDIVKRAQFLLQIVPVPSAVATSAANGAPKFKRAKSIAAKSATAEEDASSKAALAAWQSTRETTQLKFANTDERFALIWKHVLRFFEENTYSLDTLTRACLYRRRRARLRAHGLMLIRQLLAAASLSSVKREVISSLIPSLSSNDRDAMAGVAPDIMYRVRPCGPVLGQKVRSEFEQLYRMLLDLLKNPKQSGSHLIQATLHAFSLQYTDEDFDLVMSLGIFPALHTILLTDVETSPAAAIKNIGTGRGSSPAVPSSSPTGTSLSSGSFTRGEKKGDDDREVKESEASSSSGNGGTSEKSEVVEATAKHLTSAFALLDMLTTVLLNRRSEAVHVSSHDQQPVYDILLSQLTQIAAATKVDVPEGVYHPTLPSNTILKGGSSANTDKLDERLATKAGTVTAFGMQTTTAEMGDLGNVDEKEIISDAFNIRVLNLVDNICRLPEGCAHVATPTALSSLLTVLIHGTPRATVVVMRILRKILCARDGNAPSLTDVDRCVASIDDTTPLPSNTVAGTRTIQFFLRHMGQGITCPAFGAVALSSSAMSVPSVRDVITRFRFSRLYSSDGVATWAEEAMLIRYLAQHHDAWKNVISQVTLKYMITLPEMMQHLTTFDDATKTAALGNNGDLWNNVWLAVGALSVYGGHVDTLRVGTRVHLPSTGTNGTVVSRNPTAGTITMVSDGEGAVSVEPVTDVSCVGDIAFSLATFDIGLDQQTRLLTVMNTIIEQVKDQLHDEDEKKELTVAPTSKPKSKKAAAAPAKSSRSMPPPGSLRSGRGAPAKRAVQGPQGPPGTQMYQLEAMDVEEEDGFAPASSSLSSSSSAAAAAADKDATLEDDEDDIDLGNPDDDDNDRDELQIDDKPDSTAAAILIGCIRSRCVRVLNTLLLHPHLVQQYMKHCKNDALFASATQITPYTALQSTASLEDRLQAITMEMTRRARPYSEVNITLRHEEPRLKLAAPKLEFDTEYTRIGTKIAESKSLIGSLSYIRLNETPTAEVCRGRIVMVDTYGEFEERLNMIAEYQPVAVILALHTDNVKAEGLDETDGDDGDTGGKGGKKGKKGKKGGKAKKKKSEDDDDDTDVIAQSQSMALSMAAAGAAGGFDLSGTSFTFAQPSPFQFGGGGGGGFGGGGFGGGGLLAMPMGGGFGGPGFRTRGAFGGGGMGGMSLGGEGPSSSSSSSRSAPKASKMRRSKSDGKVEPTKPSEAAKKLPIVAIPTATAESLRILLGVRDNDSPERLFKKSLSDELIGKGYPKEHTYRALKKNDFDVDKAAEWLDQNKEWLYKPNQIMMEMDDDSASTTAAAASGGSVGTTTPPRPRGVSAASIADTNLDDIIDADPSAIAMERTWNRFAKETPTSESLQQFQDSARRTDTCDAGWYKEIITKSTWYLLSELRDTERSLFIHYARRSLMSLFIRCPFGTPLSALGSKQMLRRTLRVGLSLTGHPAAALEPTHYLDHGVYRTEVLSTVMSRSRVGDGDLLAVLVDDCYELLLASLTTRTKKSKPKLRTIQATCTSNLQMNMPGTKLEMAGFSSIRIKFEMDQQSSMNGVQMRIRFYSDAACTQLIKQVMEGGGMPSEGEITIPRNVCWYQVQSPSYYHGANPMTITFHCRDTATGISTSDADTMRGGVEAALVEIDLILRSQQRVAPRLALLLLRSLAKCGDSNLAQETCRAAIRLFNHWKGSVLVDDRYKGDVRAISRLVDGLERTHSSLRTGILVNWNSGAAPGPHLQTLLELVLSARSAIPANTTNEDEDDGFERVSADGEAEPWVVDAYKKYRDGRHTCSLINASSSTLVKDLTLSTGGNQQNRRFGNYEFFVGDVCVRGGKWYFEVKLLGPPDFISIGWVTREYRANTGNLGTDQQGNSWCLTGGSNGSSYTHRGVQRTPVVGNKSKDVGGVAVFAAGTVIGVMLDMENREMQFTFAGKSTGIAFSGFEPDGLFPAIIMGYNAQVTINFGKEPFTYSADSKEQFAGLEDPRIKGSSWLARYQHASDCTRYLYDRTTLPSSVITTALERDVTLTADSDIRFEVTKTDTQVSPGNSPGNMLLDTPAYFQSAKTTNLHVTFNVASENTEVILQEVTVKCYQYIRGVCGLIFVSQNVPDFESFQWCDGWQREQYTRFANRKKATEEPYRAHEPVGFFTTPDSFARIKLEQPRRGRYITLKISSLQPQNGLFIERIIFTAIHGSHPLGALLGTNQLEKKQAELRDALQRDAVFDKNWTLDHDEQLVLLIQTFCSKLGVSPTTLDAIMFTPSADQLLRFKFAEDISMGMLRARFSIIKYLNRLVTPLLHYVDIRLYQSGKTIENKSAASVAAASSSSGESKEVVASKDAFTVDEKSLSYIVHQLKGLFFYSTKKSVFDALLASGISSTSTPGSPFGGHSMPRVEINRIKASRAKESGKDTDGVKSVFGQLFTQIKAATKYDTLKGKKNQQMWSTSFMGEGSIDVGGPYRECLSNCCADLMSDTVPLFVRSPNRRNDVGQGRDRWVVNPGCTSQVHMDMYEFVGVLMGIALRTSFSLNLDLPSFVWKQLLGEKVEVSDLEAIDKLFIQAIGELGKLSKDKFEDVAEQKFTTQLSNGKEVELKKDGRTRNVTYELKDEFFKLSIDTRLHEADQQIRAMRKGLNQIVPANYLGLFSWFDLELMVCGNPEIDLEVLRKHTVYNSISATSSLVKYFWQTMESFNTEERQMFLRFVWGRSRLPVSEGDWVQQFTINPLIAGDDKLPIAHTCFFSIDLPNYSSYEVMRKKLHFAIYNCQAIDVDFNPDSSSLNAWVEME